MRLIIQIPCYNEAATIPRVLADLPRVLEGVGEVQTLVVDDGSTDGTADAARGSGVDFIVRNGCNLGLARTFGVGLEACLSLGADIIVNTDGDNQYVGADVARLIAPIVRKEAEIVIGCRNIREHKEFSRFKKLLQVVGSRAVKRLSGVDIPDATSGFRAISRSAAIRLSVMSGFSYTLETLIQGGRAGLKVTWVPVNVNAKTRESRLFRSVSHFVVNQLMTLSYVYVSYCPMRFFSWLAGLFGAVSVLLSGRILYYVMGFGPAGATIKTGTTTVLLFTALSAVVFLVAGLLGAVLQGLRFLLTDLRTRIRNMVLQQGMKPFNVEIEEVGEDAPGRAPDGPETGSVGDPA